MNPDSGHLVANLALLDEIARKDYVRVPKGLRKEAERVLAGEAEAMVDLTDPSLLSAWAAKVRAYRTEKPEGKAAQRRLRQRARNVEKAGGEAT